MPNLSLLERNRRLGLSPLRRLLLAMFLGFGHSAGLGQAPTWTFVPQAAVLPPSLSGGSILAVGPGVLVVRESGNLSARIVFGSQSSPFLAAGDLAPGGGTFIAPPSNLGNEVNVLAVSPKLIVFQGTVRLSEAVTERRFYRWQDGTLIHLPTPSGVLYDLEINDGQGRFLARRNLDSLRKESWITDGLVDRPSVVFENAFGGDEERTGTVVGITADGALLFFEQRLQFEGSLRRVLRSLYFRGARDTVIASSTLNIDPDFGIKNGTEVSSVRGGFNSAGDVLVREDVFVADVVTVRKLLLVRSAGATELVAQTGERFSGFSTFRMENLLTTHPQPIFVANLVPAGRGLFTGPGLESRFGGNFEAGFGEPGEVTSILTFHDRGVMLVNARLASGVSVRALGSTAVIDPAADTDSDGLLDVWETEGRGIDINGDGIIDLDLFALGARPNHKDLFVEIDATPSDRPIRTAALNQVVAAFANAPVNNPDGSTGIRLHLAIDEKDVRPEFGATPNDQLPAGFREVTKPAHFGTPGQRADPNREHILAAKRRAYRYCIIYNSITFAEGGGYLGTAEIKGNDFVVHIGAKTFHDGFRDTEDQAATFMHELGHTLGLQHGGGVDEVIVFEPKSWHGKPNYPSIMNYALAHPYRWSARFWRLDFCREKLPDLNETSLNERAGIPSSRYRNFSMPYGVGPTTQRAMRLARLDGRPIDFTANGFMSSSVSADLNFIGAAATFAGVDRPSPQEVMKGHNDWEAIHYAVVDREGPLAGDVALAEGCPTVEIHDLLDRLVPVEADTYEEWIAAYAEEGPGQVTLTGFSDDPDDDGIPNGIERYFGTNPTEANAAFELVPGAVPPVFRHSRTLSPPADLVASYQWTTDLRNWHASGETAGGVTVHLDPVTAKEPGPMGDLVEIAPIIVGNSPPTLFLRMRVKRTSE